MAGPTRELGLTLALFGVASMLVSAFLIGPVVKRIGERRSLLVGLSLGRRERARIACVHGKLFLMSIPISSLGGLTSPSLMAIASRQAGEAEQGRLQGALSSLQGIAMMLAPLCSRRSFRVSIRRGGRPYSGAAFAFSALVMCMALVLAARATRSAARRDHYLNRRRCRAVTRRRTTRSPDRSSSRRFAAAGTRPS